MLLLICQLLWVAVSFRASLIPHPSSLRADTLACPNLILDGYTISPLAFPELKIA